MTYALILHQLRFDLLVARRNRRAQFFVVALPVMLLVCFAGLFGTGTVEAAGHEVAANRASVPGIIGLAVLTSSFMALAMSVVGLRQTGILKRRRATPCPAWILVASRALTATISSLAACAVLVAVAGGAYGIHPPAGGLPALGLTVVVGSLCFAACGYAISTTVSTVDAGQPILQAILLPLQLVSGIYFPSSQLPDWLQQVAGVFPLVHLTDALQHAWLQGGAEIAWGDLGIMALWAAAAGVIAARRFRWLPAG
jgi:ABC-2 type transport system permease protein